MSPLEINPWKTIWTEPKKTLRAIVSYNPNYRLGVLVTLYGLVSLLSFSQSYVLGNYMTLFPLLLLVVLVAPIWGYLMLSFYAVVVFGTGKLLSGAAKYREVRAALAWSNVPLFINFFTWIVLLLIFGVKVFQGFPGGAVLAKKDLSLLLLISVVQMTFIVWSLVILINGLAEVQKFSILRTIGNLLLATLLVAVVSLIIITAFLWTCSPFFDQPVMVSI